MWLTINPLDVWMFRDGKPFTSGDNHIAQSLFPPSAFTVQGMLRSLLIEQSGIDWDEYRGRDKNGVPIQQSTAVQALIAQIGDPNQQTLGEFKMYGPYVARWNHDGLLERYFPLPSDVVKRDSHGFLEPLQPTKTEIISDLSPALVGLDLQEGDKTPEDPLWLSETRLIGDYASGYSFGVDDKDTSEWHCISQEQLFTIEYRVGTAIDYQSNMVKHEEGMLYTAGFIRLEEGVCLLIELPDDTPLETVFPSVGTQQFVRLGGEGRGACITRVNSEEIYFPEATPVQVGRQKIVFLTPAYFLAGWQPSDTSFKEALVSAAVARPLAMGGWDLANRRPRAILNYVAPGSVYYLADADFKQFDFLTEQPDNNLPLSALGFGEFFTANW